jgi:hypothetical protein
MATLWITNISKKPVSIGDLGLLMQPYQSVNLLDDKNKNCFTPEQVKNSIVSGSIFNLSNFIKIRNIPPNAHNANLANKIMLEEDMHFPSRIRSILEHKEFNYEEQYISDEEYANENADLANEDDVGKFRKV